jgi:iron complex transport system substrate-binding protein
MLAGAQIPWAAHLLIAVTACLPCGPVLAQDGPPSAARIVSLATPITEIVVGLGAAGSLVAVTSDAPEGTGPRHATRLSHPDTESILAARPTLVLALADPSLAPILAALRDRGVDTRTIEAATLAEIFAAYRAIATLVGRPGEGQSMVHDVSRRLAAVSASVLALPRRKAVLVLGREPLRAAGGPGIYTNLIEVAGAENVLEFRLDRPVAEISVSAIVEAAPDVVVDATGARDAGLGAGLEPPPAWRHASIPPIETTPLSSSALLRVARDIRRAFYPDHSGFALPGVKD